MTSADHQAPAFHEVDAFWWFTDNGLSPYWALSGMLRDNGWNIEADLEIGGETWHAQMNFHQSGLLARDGDAISGEDGRLIEIDLYLDGPGESKAHYCIRPRFDGMRKAESGEEANIPWCGGEGVDVHIQGSNLAFDEYHYLLQRSLQSIAQNVGTDLSRRYFNRIRPDSNIATVELYVRLKREYAKKLTRAEGAFYRLMHLMVSKDNASWGYSGNTENGVAKRHAFDLKPDGAQHFIPSHNYGRRLKCYHPKYVRSEETSGDALSSPKFGAAFHKILNSHEGVKWKDRGDLLRELEESITNVLEWSGIPIGPDPTVFVEDLNFEVQESERNVAIVSDPTPALEAEQDLLIMRTLDDLMPSAESVTKRLATDGGKHVGELAEETDYSISQVYRALRQLGDLVENENGLVQLTSEKIRQDVAAMVDNLEQEVAAKANRIANLCNLETRSAADSAIQKWMHKYGVKFLSDDSEHSEGTLRFDTMLSHLRSTQNPRLKDVLEEGLKAWRSVGRKPLTFYQLQIDAKVDGNRLRGRVKTHC